MHRVNYSWNEEYYEQDFGELEPPVRNTSPVPTASRALMKTQSNSDFDPASPSAKLTWIGATVTVGRKAYCKGWIMFHPGNFFVVRRNWWNRLERHQAQIQKFFKRPVPKNFAKKGPKAVDDPVYKPDPKMLKFGQIIAVYHRAEWHRGLILQIYEEKAIFKVMLVDFGEHKNFNLEAIRLLPEKFVEFPAQAIKCCLYFDGPGKALSDPKFEWCEHEAVQFRKLMDPCMFYMEFVEYDVDWELANPIIWKCRVQRILSDHDLNFMYKVEKMFVSDMLLNRLQKFVEDRREKQKKKKEAAPESLWFGILKPYSVEYLKDSKGCLNESMSKVGLVFCSARK